jgi:hypothetical protein
MTVIPIKKFVSWFKGRSWANTITGIRAWGHKDSNAIQCAKALVALHSLLYSSIVWVHLKFTDFRSSLYYSNAAGSWYALTMDESKKQFYSVLHQLQDHRNPKKLLLVLLRLPPSITCKEMSPVYERYWNPTARIWLEAQTNWHSFILFDAATRQRYLNCTD